MLSTLNQIPKRQEIVKQLCLKHVFNNNSVETTIFSSINLQIIS